MVMPLSFCATRRRDRPKRNTRQFSRVRLAHLREYITGHDDLLLVFSVSEVFVVHFIVGQNIRLAQNWILLQVLIAGVFSWVSARL